MARKSERDEDAVTAVTRLLRGSTPELRTAVMECVVGSMIDSGSDWGSISLWHGYLENALMQYFQMLGRTEQAVCQHCYHNLGPGLQDRLRGKISVERAMR
jgi:hypothetical protein